MDFFRDRRIERKLRHERPRPSDDLISRISSSIDRQPRRRRWNVGFAIGMTAALTAAIALTGGMSYAATTVANATRAVAKLVTVKTTGNSVKSDGARPDRERGGGGSGDDQYRDKVLMCKPRPERKVKAGDDDPFADGRSIRVRPGDVPDRLGAGWILGACPRDTDRSRDQDDD